MARKCQWPISRDYLDSFIVFSKDNVEHTSCSSLKHFGCYGETKEMWGTKGFICIKLQVTVAEVTTVCPGGESRQEFETAARSRNHGGASLADFLVHSGFHSAGFLRELRTPCSGTNAAHSGLGALTSFNQQDNPQQTCSPTHLMRTITQQRLFREML